MTDSSQFSQDDSQNQKGTKGQLPTGNGHIFKIPPHPNTVFDEEYFLTLLEGSISLNLEEKKRVIEAIPRLGIEQIEELIQIFEDEKTKFADLEEEFAEDVEKLKEERQRELETQKIREEENEEESENEEEAEALKRKLLGE